MVREIIEQSAAYTVSIDTFLGSCFPLTANKCFSLDFASSDLYTCVKNIHIYSFNQASTGR